MRTLGVLGGIGPQATIDFESRVHAVSQERIPQDLNRGYPPMVTVFLRHPVEAADAIVHQIQPVDEKGAIGDVDRDLHLRLGHRQHEEAEALNSLAGAQRFPCKIGCTETESISGGSGLQTRRRSRWW